ncbi:MAG TPA: hypothetical protein VEB00_05435 [Clostridia bacterium]|nr:hypothetical protein [Clostridia bacterium]
MRKKSEWGSSPTRIYRILNRLEKEKDSFTTCIVGCSDGKFVLPFARKKHFIVGYDIDRIALYGGKKLFPIKRDITKKYEFESTEGIVGNKITSYKIPTEERDMTGLLQKIKKDGLEKYVEIRLLDFFKSEVDKKYDLVFTSCSLHYKNNNAFSLEQLINKLKDAVEVDGYLYIDYMMTLFDYPTFESDLFCKPEQMKSFFVDEDWKVEYYREMKKPVFEAAHVDCVYDHFHRFGYLLAKRLK